MKILKILVQVVFLQPFTINSEVIQVNVVVALPSLLYFIGVSKVIHHGTPLLFADNTRIV